MTGALLQQFPMPAGRRAQLWRHQPAYRRPAHFHGDLEFNLVLRGSCAMQVGHLRHRLTPGRGVFLTPGQAHEMIEADATLELWVMALRPELTERVLGAGGCFLTGPREFGTFGLREQLAGLSELSDGACVEGRIGELFVMLSQQPSLHVLSRRALQLLHSDPASEAGHLAERLGTHPSVLSRRFHRDLGASLVDHRTKVRLLRFIEDVDRGATLIQASLDAGFGSYSQLTRCFRRVIGCTASEYFAGERWELSEQLCVAERPV